MKPLEIKEPADIKTLSITELEQLAQEIRRFLIRSLSTSGGHLSSNLGIVELTLALHYVFSSPKDKIIFDVGHQSYTHKILTGRSGRFHTLRKQGGLSGYQKRSESVHDSWEAGHSSTSLSAALGMAIARDALQEDYEIIPVIGDGALTGGMALEALNDLGAQSKKVIIIFNDNNMSISRNLSGIEKRITDIRTSPFYRSSKSQINSSFGQHIITRGLLSTLHHSREFLKRELIKAPLFTQFNVDYLGPVDGHDIKALIRALEAAKEHEGPIVVHVKTTKGKGFLPAEQDQVGLWHGVGPFDPFHGTLLKKPSEGKLEWAEVIAKTLITLASNDPAIHVISPAMMTGSRLLDFQKLYPERSFDVGIAEQHAITMAGGMAAGGLKPFVSIYSSFLQRAYDQIHHDLARMKLPVVVGVDHAGLVGEDGETHQGIYDIAFLRTIPGIVICQPKDSREAQNLLYSAFEQGEAPYFIRYPKGLTDYEPLAKFQKIPTGSWSSFSYGNPKAVLITYGESVNPIRRKCMEKKLPVQIINARFFKPLDEQMLETVASRNLPVLVYEPDTPAGGLYSALAQFYADRKLSVKMERIGLDDTFVPHGKKEDLLAMEQAGLEDVIKRLEEYAAG